MRFNNETPSTAGYPEESPANRRRESGPDLASLKDSGSRSAAHDDALARVVGRAGADVAARSLFIWV